MSHWRLYAQSHAAARGVTLLELVIYIGLVAGLISSLSLFFFYAHSARLRNQMIADVEQEGARVLELMLGAIRNADNITSPPSPSPGGPATSALQLDVFDVAKDPTVFDTSGSVLRRKEGTSPAMDLTSGRVAVSTLSFINLTPAGTPGTVRVQFTLSTASASGPYTYSRTFYGSASLR